MKFRNLPAILILFFITACNGRAEIGLEHSSTTTDSPTITSTMTLFPTSTLAPIDLQLSPATQTSRAKSELKIWRMTEIGRF